ncbi:MAG: helix-turn-helix domain-containing protein [Bacteroidetes bacterium]|nr:helix-turn-helix domain-containing protein [Bacteroidota bacterium]
MAKIASNKIVAFSVPQTEHEVVRVQTDQTQYFYDQLHQHPEIQIMLIESGEGTLIAGDFVGRFGAGDVYVIGSGLPHVFRCDQAYYDQPAPIAKSISLYFSEKYFGHELWNANETSALREFAEKSKQCFQLESPAVIDASAVIRKLAMASGLDKIIEFFSLIKLLTNTSHKKVLSIQPGRLQTSEEGRMNTIIGFTFRESHRKIYLSEVARLAHLSEEAFCRYFKLHTQKTYINFLNEVRVSHACQLLIQKEISIQQVCYQAGFTNVSNFNRIFKKITAKTPATFRKQVVYK